MATAKTHHRLQDPFRNLVTLLEAATRAPLPPVLLIQGDDEWFVKEGARRAGMAFRKAFVEGEVCEYEGTASGVREAVNDVSTIALFSTNRLVIIEGTEIFRGKKVSGEEVEELLDQAKEAGLGAAQGAPADPRALQRISRKLRAALRAAGIATGEADAATKAGSKFKMAGRAPEIAAVLAQSAEDASEGSSPDDILRQYLEQARPGDNTLLVHAVNPDPEHHCVALMARIGTAVTLVAPDEASRRDRLAALGFERAVERGVSVDGAVFETLTERGRLTARAFLNELDRLISGAVNGRVTAEAAARLVVDEKKEYGSDLVEAIAQKRFTEAIQILERLLKGESFSAFRPQGKEDGSKGPKGEAAFFPILALLTNEFRRMLSLKSALTENREAGTLVGRKRPDYRTFSEQVLSTLKNPMGGAPPLAVEGHPFVLFKSFQNLGNWSLKELGDGLLAMAAIDKAVKTGDGDGPEMFEAFLLERVGKK
jgi:DNA polymerase III delta subunit